MALDVLLQVELLLLELLLDVLVVLRVLDVLDTSKGPRCHDGRSTDELRCLSCWSRTWCCSPQGCAFRP